MLMPCRCDGGLTTEEQLREEADTVSRLLCEVCEKLEHWKKENPLAFQNPYVSTELYDWYLVNRKIKKQRKKGK